MSNPIYDPFDDLTSEAPVSRFVLMVLLNAKARRVERIHFERIAEGLNGNLAITYEKDGIFTEIEEPPWELWHDVVSRLKVMARMVDYGSNKSTEGQITLRTSKNRTVEFLITSNPNPHSDTKVTVVYKG